MIQEAEISTDNLSLVVIGLIALVIVWLVFSMVRRVFGLVLLIVVALGAWMLWSNPDMLAHVMDVAEGFLGR